MILRRLTDIGMQNFSHYLDTLKHSPKTAPPQFLLQDDVSAEPLGTPVEVEPRRFESQLAAASYLHEVFTAGRVSLARPQALISTTYH